MTSRRKDKLEKGDAESPVEKGRVFAPAKKRGKAGGMVSILWVENES